LEKVEKLNQAEQPRFLGQIAVLIRSKASVKTRRSILELQGMGENIWKNIDAQKYVDKKRASWNGYQQLTTMVVLNDGPSWR